MQEKMIKFWSFTYIKAWSENDMIFVCVLLDYRNESYEEVMCNQSLLV